MSLPHAALPHDTDPQLDALRAELRAVLASLNEAHHPVYPAPPERIRNLEAQLAELRTQINQRRAALRQS